MPTNIIMSGSIQYSKIRVVYTKQDKENYTMMTIGDDYYECLYSSGIKVCVIKKFSLVNWCHAELVGKVSLVWQVRMQNVIGVGCDATE